MMKLSLKFSIFPRIQYCTTPRAKIHLHVTSNGVHTILPTINCFVCDVYALLASNRPRVNSTRRNSLVTHPECFIRSSSLRF